MCLECDKVVMPLYTDGDLEHNIEASRSCLPPTVIASYGTCAVRHSRKHLSKTCGTDQMQLTNGEARRLPIATQKVWGSKPQPGQSNDLSN